MRHPQSLLTLMCLTLATAPCRADTPFGLDVGAMLANREPNSFLLGALGVVVLLMVLALWRGSISQT